MKAKRKRHDAGFKARVALEALKGEKTIQQIAKEFDLHPVQVSEWKKKLLEGASGVFAGGGSAASGVDEASLEKLCDPLHAKIGKLTVELDWLRKKSKQLGLCGKDAGCWRRIILKSASGGRRRCWRWRGPRPLINRCRSGKRTAG